MKILILGLGKSGTTAMVYKMAGGLPNCHAFSGGQPGTHIGNYENAIYKHTYSERKGKSFDLYKEHLQKESYDRRVWIARDPRDAAISRMLFRWHNGHKGKKKQYAAHLELVLKKEKDPASISFAELCRYSGHNDWPSSISNVVAEEQVRYDRMHTFVKGLGDNWFLFKYEDMISENFESLNEYLGFAIKADGEVPVSTGKAKVVRKKASGDWRQWYTEQDIELFKPAYRDYMALIGYDLNDWVLNENPVIEPEYSSIYIQNLCNKAERNIVQRFLGSIVRRIAK
ncbi:hypothetical protein ACFL2E_00565 [Thermodesulfobacteriota bacterium]